MDVKQRAERYIAPMNPRFEQVGIIRDLLAALAEAENDCKLMASKVLRTCECYVDYGDICNACVTARKYTEGKQ